MKKKKILKSGWSIRGRPFSPKEYASSYLKKNNKISYQKYLEIFAKMYSNVKTRRGL